MTVGEAQRITIDGWVSSTVFKFDLCRPDIGKLRERSGHKPQPANSEVSLLEQAFFDKSLRVRQHVRHRVHISTSDRDV